MWKCTVCGYIHGGAEAPEACPKCGAPKDKLVQLSEEQAALVLKSLRTNDIHMKLCSIMDKVITLCEEGADINLDPGCLVAFKKGIEQSQVFKNIIKAEIATHVGKNKW